MNIDCDDPWWVYILRCRDGALYVGITNDPDRRMSAHAAGPAAGGARSVRGHGGPDRFLWLRACSGRGQASRAEYRLKRLGSRRLRELADGTLALADVAGLDSVEWTDPDGEGPNP